MHIMELEWRKRFEKTDRFEKILSYLAFGITESGVQPRKIFLIAPNMSVRYIL